MIMAKPKKDARYRSNPFRDVVVHTVTGVRTIYGSPKTDSNAFAMVSRETGEDFGDIAFGKQIKVDKTDFLKLYANGVKMFLDLKPAGIKVFMLVYDYLLSKAGWQTDSVVLIYDMLDDEVQKDISQATFYRGIKDLINANFLAPSLQAGTYWINTDYVFRGDRLTLVNQYILEPSPPELEQGKVRKYERVENNDG